MFRLKPEGQSSMNSECLVTPLVSLSKRCKPHEPCEKPALGPSQESLQAPSKRYCLEANTEHQRTEVNRRRWERSEQPQMRKLLSRGAGVAGLRAKSLDSLYEFCNSLIAGTTLLVKYHNLRNASSQRGSSKLRANGLWFLLSLAD